MPQVPPRLRVALQLSISAVLLAVLFSQLDWDRAVELIGDADLRWVAALFAVHATDRVLMALKWHQLLHVLDRHLTRLNAIRVYYESSFVGFALPLGGLGPDIVRFFRLRTYGVDAHVTLASMVMERLLGIVASLSLVVLSFTLLAGNANDTALQRFSVFAASGIFCVAACGALLIFWRPSTRAAMRLVTWAGLTRRINIDKYREAGRAYSNRRGTLGVNLVLSLTEQMMPVMAYFVGSRALGAPLPFWVCLTVAPVTAIIQRLPISYAGLGLREGGAAAVLVGLGYAYSDALILSMTLFTLFVISLLPGAVILLVSGPPPRRLPSVESQVG